MADTMICVKCGAHYHRIGKCSCGTKLKPESALTEEDWETLMEISRKESDG